MVIQPGGQLAGHALDKVGIAGLDHGRTGAAALKAEAKKNKELAAEFRAFWFYDLRAKAADGVAEVSGDHAASDLLGHDSVQTKKDHYLRCSKIVNPSK